MIFIQGGRFWR